MCIQPFRMVSFAVLLAALGPAWAGAQEPTEKAAPPAAPPAAEAEPAPAAEKAAAAPLEGPPPIPKVNLLPTLHTVPVQHGRPAYNVQLVDASVLPRDKEGIWVLDFAFKPMRLKFLDVPGKGRKTLHYLYYRVVNRTGAPRNFVPQFTLVTDTGQRKEEAVMPQAVGLINIREDGSIPLLGAVSVNGVIPTSKKQGVDDAVYGVAIWEDVDAKADALHVYVRGLSDGYKEVSVPGKSEPITRYKTLRIDFIRRGDERNLSEKEIQLNEPPYEWVYW